MIKINLLAIRVPKEHILVNRQISVLVALLLLSVIAGILWTNSVSAEKARIEEQLSVEKTELARLQKVAARIQEFETKKKRREEILEAIKKLEVRKVGPTPFLDDLNIILPPDIWLTKVTENNFSLTISGYTFSTPAVADLMRSMEVSEHFSGIELTEIQKVDFKGEEVKKFTLTCRWETPATDIAEIEKQAAQQQGGSSASSSTGNGRRMKMEEEVIEEDLEKRREAGLSGKMPRRQYVDPIAMGDRMRADALKDPLVVKANESLQKNRELAAASQKKAEEKAKAYMAGKKAITGGR